MIKFFLRLRLVICNILSDAWVNKKKKKNIDIIRISLKRLLQ